ncbi:hypothetical protein STEG23_029417 [Scotinomys teguina]
MKAMVHWKDLATGIWQQPAPLLARAGIPSVDRSEALKIHKGKVCQSHHNSQLWMGPQPWSGSRGEEIHTQPLSHLSDISSPDSQCVTIGDQWRL